MTQPNEPIGTSDSIDYALFDAEAYVRCKFPQPGESGDLLSFSDIVLKYLAKFYKVTLFDVPGNSLKVLDYGCGPSLPFSISAATKASEIVLAEYSEPNRQFLKRWLEKDPLAYNWMPYFEHVVQTLEGGSKEEAVRREDNLRKKVKNVIDCDISKDQFIADGYEGMYDL